MKLKSLLPFLIILLCNILNAQEYVSELEKNTILSFEKDSTDYDFIKTLCVLDENISLQKIENFKTNLDSFIKTLPESETDDRREKKRVQKIYDAVHKEYLRKYENVAYFPQLINDGTYNCVTSTALYTYIFEALKIPFHIKDLPSHVYMIAYPETLKIQLETTAPGSYGFISPKSSEVKKSVENMVKLKLVSSEEVSKKGENKVYMDYFYGENSLDKKGLIGMQYFNKALEAMEQEDFKASLNQINKSLVFYPYAPSEYLQKTLAAINLDHLKFNSNEDITALYDSFSTLEYGKDFQSADIKYYLNKIVQNDANELAFIENSAKKLAIFDNAELNVEIIDFIYDYLASTYANNSDLEESLRSSDTLLKYNSNNKKAKSIVIYAINNKINTLPKTEESYELIVEYYKKYPFIEGSFNIETGKAGFLGQLSYNLYQKKEAEKADNYRTILEEQLDKYNDKVQLNPEAISQLFLMAGRYYYGKLNYKKAQEIFEKGLSYNPTNAELQKMIKWTIQDSKK